MVIQVDFEQLESIIAHLRAQGTDDAEVEVKRSGQRLSSDIWESVSAFANTAGGIIILGLSEPEGFTAAKGFDLQANLDDFISGVGDGETDSCKLENPPKYSVERHEFEGSPLLVITIMENETGAKPCFIRGRGMVAGSYKRVDDKDIKLSPTELYELQNILRPSKDDRDIVPEATIDDLNADIINQIIATARMLNSKATRGTTDQAVIMRRLNITNANGDIRMAGMLVAGDYPQMFYPKLVIDVASYPDTAKSAPGKPRFLDRKVCEGPLPEVMSDAIAAIERNLKTYSIVDGAGRHDEQEIPRDVLREAIANALVHREYNSAFVGQAVSAEIYPDRVVIKSPGGLWGGKTVENLADGSSACRNSTLMSLMRYVALTGEVGAPAEGNGTGIDLMLREMAAKSLPAPEFNAEIDAFTVTLGRHGTEIAEFQAWLSSIGCSDLPQLERATVLTMKRTGSKTVKELHEQLGCDSDEVRAALGNLLKRGLLVHDEGGSYTLAINVTSSVGSGTPPGIEEANGTERHSSLEPREAIVELLEKEGTLSTREISEAIGRPVYTVRYHLNRLIADGAVAPTAEATSKYRRYVLA